MIVTFEEFRPAHDFFDYTMSQLEERAAIRLKVHGTSALLVIPRSSASAVSRFTSDSRSGSVANSMASVNIQHFSSLLAKPKNEPLPSSISTL